MSKLFSIIMIFLVFTVVLSLAPSKPATASGSAPVTVMNTPLPVQGTVSASQSGTWNVGINGTPTVNVSSLPAIQFASGNTVGINGPVQVGNDAANPAVVRDVDNPARQPFQKLICVAFGNEANNCGALVNGFTVQAGRRLVIEQVSGSCELESGTVLVSVALGTQVGSLDVVAHFLPLPPPPTPTPTVVYSSSFNHVTRIYADPGSGVGINSGQFLGSTGTDAVCRLALSGYLLNP